MHAQCQMPNIIQDSASILHTIIPLIYRKHVYTKEFKGEERKPPHQPKHKTYKTYMYTRAGHRKHNHEN